MPTVTKQHSCPACGHTDWCAWNGEGPDLRLRCQRPDEGGTPAGMRVMATGTDGGGAYALYAYERRDTPPPPLPRPREVPMLDPVEVEAAALAWAANLNGELAARHARDLGVSAAALADFRVGIATARDLDGMGTVGRNDCLTHPMVNVFGHIVGVRLVDLDNGEKRTLAGSKNGLFLPAAGCAGAVTWIVEGRSDCLAMRTLDPNACVVGRPNNTGMPLEIAAWVRQSGARHAVIIPDNDRDNPQTVRGAEDLHTLLVGNGISSRIVYPGKHPDLRSAVKAGLTMAQLQAAVKRVKPEKGAKPTYGKRGAAA